MPDSGNRIRERRAGQITLGVSVARAYRMTSYLCLAFAAAVIHGLSSCSSGTAPCETPFGLPPEGFADLEIKEGIAGYVFFWEGDFLALCPTGVVTPVARFVIAYPRLEASQKEEAGGSFARVPDVEPIDSVWSDSEGFYQITLPPGEYTLFVREDSLLYFNGRNTPTVLPDSVTKLRVNIDYKAVF